MSYHLLGASGHAKVIMDIAQLCHITIVGLYDKDEEIIELKGLKVSPESLVRPTDSLLISIGNNKIRKELSEKFSSNSFFSLRHPSTIIDNMVEIGVGSVIMAGVVINSDTKIGRHCIINTSASVDHDCAIGDFVHVAPNATLCGGISIGEGTLVGAGAVILPNIEVGNWVKIGGGSVITRNVADGQTVVGNPARVMKP